MQKVDLLYYFELAQNLARAQRILSSEKISAATIYFAVSGMEKALENFSAKAIGFTTAKHTARSLATAIVNFRRIYIDNDAGEYDFAKFNTELTSWQWSSLAAEIDKFQVVFMAECNDLEIYSVGQLSIYNISALVSQASERFPLEYRDMIPSEALLEFDNAGKCLAFNLPTASGFHSLRGVELCILAYLRKRLPKVEKLKSWHQYFVAIEKLEKESKPPHQPSPKVAAMIQRMKDLDRNPLMHPHDTLDIAGADQLFNLASVTVIELAKDDHKLREALKSVETLPSPPMRQEPSASL